MENNIVLILMQIKGINRKTIYNEFKLNNNIIYSINDIVSLFREAALDSKRIELPTVNDVFKALDKTKYIIEESYKKDINIVSFLDSKFPDRLKGIQDPPALLYYKGNLNSLENKTIAVIGTREPTNHGIDIATRLGEVLGRDNYTVVSGLAIGCDKFAHEGCVNSKGKTIAILPCGLDTIYPAAHKDLAMKIIENNGCLISEYSIGTKPFKSYFVERDRLQSGLSDAVIVVETDIIGGTMHTVGYALEYKRILGCYNHPVQYLNQKKTFGNQTLIKEGKAIPISNDADLSYFKNQINKGSNTNPAKLNEVEFKQSSLFDFLTGEYKNGDNI